MTNGKNPSKRDVAEDMKAKANQASQEVKAQAQRTSEDMKSRGRDELEKRESQAADAMDQVAEATEAAAHELEQRRETAALSHYVSELADGISGLSGNLRSKNTDELISDASRLARNNPGLFLLGSVAVGFGLSRIAKANRPPQERESHWEDYYGHQETSQYGSESLGSTSTTGSSSTASTGRSATAGSSTAYGTTSGAPSSGPSTGASTVGRTQSGATTTGTSTAPGATGTSGSTGTSNPTHASTSYLPEDKQSAQSPINPPKGESRTPTNKPGDRSQS
ncbi:hypothetical protein F6455_06730 [Proteobacteria bacterium 005FR1]|nr:hypothetical protein [Proteobacteria bacterium 005FR1]